MTWYVLKIAGVLHAFRLKVNMFLMLFEVMLQCLFVSQETQLYSRTIVTKLVICRSTDLELGHV